MSRRKDAGWSVFRRADGRWVLAYQPEPGHWKQRSLGLQVDEAAATRAARTWLAQSKADGTLPASTRTIADLAESWLVLRAASPNLAGSTVADNRDQLRNHITPTFGTLPIGVLTATMVRDWVRAIRGKLSPSRTRNVVNTLSAFYEDARAEGWVKAAENIVRHPSVRKEVPEAGTVREEVVTLTLDAAQQLMGDERIPEHRRVRYAVGFLVGLRDGEIAGLRWSDVLDESPPCVRVRRAHALRSHAGSHASSADPKTPESRRKVPIHPALAEALAAWRADGCERFTGKIPQDEDPIFPSPRTGKAWRPKSARDMRDDLQALGLATDTPDGSPVDFHATRRSFHTWLGEAGVDDATKAQLMGHAAKSVGGKHYTGPLMRRMAEAVACIPLRWGVAFLPDPGTVPRPFGALAPHSADFVRAHNGAAETPSSHLSSVVEQRFRNSSPGMPEEPENEGERASTGNPGAQGNGLRARLAESEERAAAFARPRRKPARRWHQLDTEAAKKIAAMIDYAIDGRTSLSESARKARLHEQLAETAKLLDERDRVRR